MSMMLIAVLLFSVIYLSILTEVVNKTVLVLFGAGLFLALKILNMESAIESVDWHVIFLLVSMMVIVNITKESGVFQYVAIKAAKFAKGEPVRILILLSLICALFSAFLDNVTTVMIIIPVTILIAIELGVSPVPFVISIVIASNIGGTATLIGDPPNIMIGASAGISFMEFLVYLGPVVLVTLILLSCIIAVLFRNKLKVSAIQKARIMEFDESRSITDKKLLVKSLSVLGCVILGFLFHGFLDLEASTIAFIGASILLLLASSDNVDKVLAEIEWGTIFFFIGLFILVGGLVETGAMEAAAEYVLNWANGDIEKTAFVILWVSGLFSAFVDNIPYVATMIPLIHRLGETLGAHAIEPLWWSLSLGACFGGNGTLIGASANVVSIGIAEKSGFKISFLQFTKYGFAVMILTLIIATIFLWLDFTFFV